MSKETKINVNRQLTIKDNNTEINKLLTDTADAPNAPNATNATDATDATNATNATDILNSIETKSQSNMTDDEIKDMIFDFDVDLDKRIKAFMHWHELPNSMIFELTNKLSTMYLFSGSSMIKEFLIELINTKGVQDMIKIEFAKTICSKNDSAENYTLLDNTILLIEDIPIVLLIECIVLLMNSSDLEHSSHALEYFTAIINNNDYEEHFRYRTILSLEFKLSDADYYITESLIEFLNCIENTSTYRILAAQALLQKYFNNDLLPTENDEIIMFDEIRAMTQESLKDIMGDEKLDINVRADAADALLNLGDEIFKTHARNVIISLGAVDGTVRNVYQDGQNIHTTAIEKSALEILEKLDKVEKYLTFTKARKLLKEVAHNLYHDDDAHDAHEHHDDDAHDTDDKSSKQTDKERMVHIALNRIQVDQQLYSQYGISLQGILLRVLTFCNTHEHKDELLKRMIEELIDMHDKCSSGYAFRLVNTLSGYCEHAIRISWADQIAGHLSGRLNMMIRNIKDEDYQEAVMTELCLNTDADISSRANFLEFLRKALPEIREAMWEDFKDDMTDSEFDLYLRRAVVKYEGHEWL